jgi:hypothetical protein
MTALQPYDPPQITRIESPQEIAVQRLTEWAESASAAYKVAEKLVQSSFVPQSFRGKAIEATAAILSGIEIGLSPMSALKAFDIISGQAAPRAITQQAVAQANGHAVELVESTTTRAVVRCRRRGAENWQTVTWTIDRARALGLVGKDNWKKQPDAMLKARALAEASRLVAADALLGIPYSSEELADGEQSTDTTTPTASTGTQRIGRRRPVEPVPDPAPDSDGLDEFHPDTTQNPTGPAPSITRQQQAALMASFNEAGITDRTDRLLFCSDATARTIDTTNALTRDEAKVCIDLVKSPDYVEKWREGSHGDGTLPVGE